MVFFESTIKMDEAAPMRRGRLAKALELLASGLDRDESQRNHVTCYPND